MLFGSSNMDLSGKTKIGLDPMCRERQEESFASCSRATLIRIANLLSAKEGGLVCSESSL